ncbi:MAG: DotI/IcmL family type IV secretion protein [Alphaproteobacteria bacterium]|nr:DotI/IcmL family type IV secretion protein [Alphaproteobacteria bacterium]
MLRLLVSAFLLCALVSGMPHRPARADLVEFFFPALKKKAPDPSETLTAPFADLPKGESNDSGGNVIFKDLPLENAHRTREEIGQWLMMSVSETLTFDEYEFGDVPKTNRRFFDESGFRFYRDFLEDQSILKVLRSGKFHMRSIIQEHPLLLNEGPVDGRYRWLFEVPVLLSFIDKNARDYKQTQPINQMMILTVQIGRSDDSPNEHKILIERWSGRAINRSP